MVPFDDKSPFVTSRNSYAGGVRKAIVALTEL
jgi:hypothetical protein